VTPGSQVYFWRTAQGNEVDLLWDSGERIVPFEIKLHSAPGAQDGDGLRRCMKDLKLPRGYLLYPGRTSYSLGEQVTALSAEKVLSSPQEITSLE
jgi:hypothetical protein